MYCACHSLVKNSYFTNEWTQADLYTDIKYRWGGQAQAANELTVPLSSTIPFPLYHSTHSYCTAAIVSSVKPLIIHYYSESMMSDSKLLTVSCRLWVDAILSADIPPTIELLVKELKDVTNWYVFGATLGVPVSTLNCIKSENSDVENKKIQMFQFWLQCKVDCLLEDGASQHCRNVAIIWKFRLGCKIDQNLNLVVWYFVHQWWVSSKVCLVFNNAFSRSHNLEIRYALQTLAMQFGWIYIAWYDIVMLDEAS